MNRGNIPGFYYDEEKKKYFKVQANHQVPKDAKYSKSSIQQDKRESKKRKLEDRRRQYARERTVRRPDVLLDPLTAAIGLYREHGTREMARSLIDRDAAFIKHLRPSRRTVQFTDSPGLSTEIAGLEPCHQSKEVVLTLRNASRYGHNSRTYTLHTLPSKNLEPEDAHREALSFTELAGPYAAFGCPVTSISTAEVGGDILLFASAQERFSPGNVFSTRLMPSDQARYASDFHSPYQMTTSNFATLGTTSSTSLWQTSINPFAKDTVAVAGTLGVWSLDLQCTPKDRLSITRRDYAEPEDDETRAVDWLDAHTIAAGSEQVYLWDQRSGGASQRFRCKGRVTGIANSDRGIAAGNDGGSTGQSLLISTNRTIGLFDVRYVSKTKPVLSWRHEHEGPQVSLTCNGQGLFAAVNRDGYVHVYSTRTGGEVARLGRPDEQGSGARDMVGNLRWFEDYDGRMGLRGLQCGDVVEWKWDGDDD